MEISKELEKLMKSKNSNMLFQIKTYIGAKSMLMIKINLNK